MQKVISNSSTIIHLAKINELTLLKGYYQMITIPAKVQKECIFEGEDRKEVEIKQGNVEGNVGSGLNLERAQQRVAHSNWWKSSHGRSRSHVAWMAGGDGNVAF